MSLQPIGRVESSLTDPEDAPKQGHEGAPEAVLALEPDVAEALEGIAPGDRLVVLTWLDRARRDVPSDPSKQCTGRRSSTSSLC
jgi:tRNA (Thr-GGU) A37 N-methylase